MCVSARSNERLVVSRLPLPVDARLTALAAKTDASIAEIRVELATQLALLPSQVRWSRRAALRE